MTEFSVGIVDYGSGNLRAIGNVLVSLGINFKIVESPNELEACARCILPGVGSFDRTMERLSRSGLLEALNQHALHYRKPFLGICVGMQILGAGSEEGNLPGLGWISGAVKKLPLSVSGVAQASSVLPHMGWSPIRLKGGAGLAAGVDSELGFYFVHSYYFSTSVAATVLATCNLGNFSFPAIVGERNIFGVQFHPEKSHANGRALLKNFCSLSAETQVY